MRGAGRNVGEAKCGRNDRNQKEYASICGNYSGFVTLVTSRAL